MAIQQRRIVSTHFLLGLALASGVFLVEAQAQVLSSASVPKFLDALPRVCGLVVTTSCLSMPTTSTANNIDYYEIAARQFQQQILPAQFQPTTVWGYGPESGPASSFHSPSATIIATHNREVRVKWINDLVCQAGDPTCTPGIFVTYPASVSVSTDHHWANPSQQCAHGTVTDCKGVPGTYSGPVPTIVHVHGASTESESDGIPEAWNLPSSSNPSILQLLTNGYKASGSDFCQIDAATGGRAANCPNAYNGDGSALFKYENTQYPATLFYHDHSLGVTLQNVYMGLVGFYLIGGDAPDFDVATLPAGDYELPLAIQAKSFTPDGSSLSADAEAIGNITVVNGKSWPYVNVEPRRYRLRLVNANAGSDIQIMLPSSVSFTQIGGDSGFLPHPVRVRKLALSPGERADAIVDFSSLATCSGTGCNVVMINDAADGDTRQVLQFRVVSPLQGTDTSVVPQNLPKRTTLPAAVRTRQVSLFDNRLGTCADPLCASAAPLGWDDPVTEIVHSGDTEIWEIFDFKDDHPVHLHEIQFEVVGRSSFSTPNVQSPPSPGETGFKDTVAAKANQITRIKVQFADAPETGGTQRNGLFAWHCHIAHHEDDEMMRPLCVVPATQGAANAENFCRTP
jgi:spore coat protein A, manganese oxidase